MVVAIIKLVNPLVTVVQLHILLVFLLSMTQVVDGYFLLQEIHVVLGLI